MNIQYNYGNCNEYYNIIIIIIIKKLHVIESEFHRNINIKKNPLRKMII